MLKVESDVMVSSYGVYTACRTRDLCLRYMGETPALWADAQTTPCPCSKEFYAEVMAYARVIRDEREHGVLPYSHRQMVAWITEKPPKVKKIKRREIPITQARLV